MSKRALIVGITGQDGAYLAELLLKKRYEVYGLKRRASSFNTERIDHLYHDSVIDRSGQLKLVYGDVTDTSNVIRLISEIQPHEIYNLAAQSHVAVSFETPEYTANADALGTLRILEAIRILGLKKTVKFYQASTSELFGKVQAIPQNEDTPFYPRSPYAAAKLYAHWITVNYREAYNMFACSGILFNHESPLRGATFVTRKITRAVARIAQGLQQCVYLGNLDSQRDWGYAKEYVEAMWLMLQQSSPRDYVIATGETHSVRSFVEKAFNCVGISLRWSGRGVNERAIDISTGNVVIKVDPVYFRPTEVDLLKGDASRAREELGWQPKTSLDALVKIMVDYDMLLAQQESHDTVNIQRRQHYLRSNTLQSETY